MMIKSRQYDRKLFDNEFISDKITFTFYLSHIIV